ncbi:alanine racemase [candidate division KSB1 bacterium]|nr:alanine racemase [candidate division KSB1 bacterium]MBL7094478.1 alanine racemase [candidate division KSB1 bacterium]
MQNFNRRDFLKFSGAASLLTLPALVNCSKNEDSPINTHNISDPWLEINLNNIAWNLSEIRQLVSPRPVMAVIKANAYGHGLVEVARFLEKQKVEFLAVGNIAEAVKVKESGVKTPVLNFGPFSSQDAEQLVRLNISQSVYTDGIERLSEAARKLNKTAKVHIKVDTGLGRVGVPYYKALLFIKKVADLPGISIEGIFTTFTEDEEFDKIQLQRFLKTCQASKEYGINVGLRHAVSSAGLLSFPAAFLDMVRPGITIYGHYPSDKEYLARKINLKPAMSLKAKVMYVKNLRPGDAVSYHRKFVAKKETRVATLPVGYSDGYPYQVAEKGEAIIQGKRWKIIAAVTANHTTLNVTGVNKIKIGDEAVLFGKQNSTEVTAENIANWVGTSVYKIVIGMNSLLKRFYIGK